MEGVDPRFMIARSEAGDFKSVTMPIISRPSRQSHVGTIFIGDCVCEEFAVNEDLDSYSLFGTRGVGGPSGDISPGNLTPTPVVGRKGLKEEAYGQSTDQDSLGQ
jgi:hypothetical protein